MPILQIYERNTSLEAWHIEVTRPLIIPNCTEYESKVSSSKNILTFINFVLSRALVAGKICIHLTQFSVTTALCCKNITDIVLSAKSCRHYLTNPRHDFPACGVCCKSCLLLTSFLPSETPDHKNVG